MLLDSKQQLGRCLNRLRRASKQLRFLWCATFPSVMTTLILVILLNPESASAIELRDSDQATLHPTEPTEITLIGQDLRSESGKAADLWCNSPVTVEVVDTENADRNRVRYRLTPTMPMGGVVTIRAYNEKSVSQAMLFFVSSPAGQNAPPESADPLEMPFGFDLKSPGNNDKTIQFQCDQGQQFCAEIIGSRIGSAVDAVLILSDQDGNELAFADDHPITGSDPVLRWTATYTGIHNLTMKDVEYRGGLRMHVRVNGVSAVGRTHPPAIRRGETRRLLTMGESSTAPLADVIMHVPLSDSPGLGFVPQSSILAPFIKSDLPVYTEAECQQVPVPALFCGTIGAASQVDSVTFDAAKSEKLIIKFESVDGPFIGDLRLFRGTEKVRDHHFGRDPRGTLQYTVPETDTYRIEIRDVLERFGPGHEYCLSIRNDLAPCILRVAPVNQGDRRIRNDKPHRQVWFNDETLPLLIRADRRGFNGPITVCAELDGLACPVDGRIEEKKNEAEVQIHLPEPVPEMAFKKLRIFGQCKVDGRIKYVPVDLSEHVKRDFEDYLTLPSDITNTIAVVVTPYNEEKK